MYCFVNRLRHGRLVTWLRIDDPDENLMTENRAFTRISAIFILAISLTGFPTYQRHFAILKGETSDFLLTFSEDNVLYFALKVNVSKNTG